MNNLIATEARTQLARRHIERCECGETITGAGRFCSNCGVAAHCVQPQADADESRAHLSSSPSGSRRPSPAASLSCLPLSTLGPGRRSLSPDLRRLTFRPESRQVDLSPASGLDFVKHTMRRLAFVPSPCAHSPRAGCLLFLGVRAGDFLLRDCFPRIRLAQPRRPALRRLPCRHAGNQRIAIPALAAANRRARPRRKLGGLLT